MPELEKAINTLRVDLDHLRREAMGAGHEGALEEIAGDTSPVVGISVGEAHLKQMLESRWNFQLAIQSFPKAGSIWGESSTVEVCWESMEASHADLRDLVRKAIADSWESVAAVRFEGWKVCKAGEGKGVRIAVRDEAPRTAFLGRGLAGVQGGMVLNFDYLAWGSAVCRPIVDKCLQATAIHEFGHALGFSHEQNRPDTPSWCSESPQGEDGDLELAQWDPDSIMNYCREGWRTGKWKEPWLSQGDVEAVQYLYGKKS